MGVAARRLLGIPVERMREFQWRTVSDVLALHPDPPPPARVAHVDWTYTAVLRDSRGGEWVCTYPAGPGARECRLVRV